MKGNDHIGDSPYIHDTLFGVLKNLMVYHGPLVALSGIWTVGEKWYCIVSHGACSAVFIHDTWNPLLGCHS